MNGYVIAGFLLALIITNGFSYWRGTVHGELITSAQVTAQASNAADGVIETSKQLVNAANAQALVLRQKNAQMEAAHAQTTATLRRALATNRNLRACLDARVPDDILRQLAAARDRAAASAATGTADAAVPLGTTLAGAAHHE